MAKTGGQQKQSGPQSRLSHRSSSVFNRLTCIDGNHCPGLDGKSPRQPQEQQWYKIKGRIVDVRVQADSDIHFELEDENGIKRGHILAEVPLGSQWCELLENRFQLDYETNAVQSLPGTASVNFADKKAGCTTK
jgi:hypothetical protein